MFARELPGVSLGLTAIHPDRSAITPSGGGHILALVATGILVNILDNLNGSTVNFQGVSS